jgi:hypothetical protein
MLSENWISPRYRLACYSDNFSFAQKCLFLEDRLKSNGNKNDKKREMLILLSRIVSESAFSVLILSHESQFQEAEGRLIKEASFGQEKLCSWQRFANSVQVLFVYFCVRYVFSENQEQERYLVVTSQDVKSNCFVFSFFFFFFCLKRNWKGPVRKLTLSDFHYIYNRFFMSVSVNSQKADRFLQWFMPVLHQVRFKRHVKPMWLQGRGPLFWNFFFFVVVSHLVGQG